MADTITNIPSARSEFLNPDGTVNRIWFKFFLNLFNLLGAGSAATVSVEDLLLDPPPTIAVTPDEVNRLFQQALLSYPTPEPQIMTNQPDVTPQVDLSYLQSQIDDLKLSVTPQSGIFSDDVVSTSGDMVMQTIGKGLRIKEGTNARMGVNNLVAGTVTVSNTSVTANTRILTTRQTLGGIPGGLSIGTVTPGTSFVINSSNATDTSAILWVLIEPS